MVNRTRAGSKKTLMDRVEPELIEEAVRAVREAKAVPLTKLTQRKLTTGARAELERLVVERGLERGAKAMRVPIEAQIKDLFRGHARVPLKEVPKRVKGAAKAEVDKVLGRLVRAGEARVVVRTAADVLVGPGEHVLNTTELERLKKLAEQLSVVLKKVSAKGLPRSILRGDIEALLEAVELLMKPASRATAEAIRLVDDALRKLENETLKLVPVPDLVRSLQGKLSVVEVHHALSEAVSDRAIELRPAAGGELLSPEDVRLCPRGPRDTVLSYARRLSP